MKQATLHRYIAQQVQESVVRIRDEFIDPSSVATGFFVDPTGYLITAFHSVKHRLLFPTGTSPITIEFDESTAIQPPTTVRRHTVDAFTTLEWCDPHADWALLKLDFTPTAYLPLSRTNQGRLASDLSDTELRVHGFTITDQDIAKISVFKGNYVGYLPDKRRHHVAYVVRTEGQSGGPVLDMSTGSVIGSVVGYRSREVLTGEAAELDQERLLRLGLNVDFPALARDWHASAARYICTQDGVLAPLVSQSASRIPALPEKMLRNRTIVADLIAKLSVEGHSSVFLHGAAGSGKTTVAAEVASALAHQASGAFSIFRHDFASRDQRNRPALLRLLALHLLLEQGLFDPITACLHPDFPANDLDVVQAVLSAVKECSIFFNFDNLHQLSAESDADIDELLAGLEAAAHAGRSNILFASRHMPALTIQAPIVSLEGFSEGEVAEFLKLYDLELTGTSLKNVCRFASSIICIEEVARSSTWRHAVVHGIEVSTSTDSLQRYWINNYADLPEDEHTLLLTVTAIGSPASRHELEVISGIHDFARTLERLQRDPPLIKSDDGYHLHSDTESAIIFLSSEDMLTRIRERIANHRAREGRLVEAARFYHLAGQTSRSLELLYDNLGIILAGGFVDELEGITAQISEETRTGQLKQGTTSHHINVLLASCHTIRGRYQQARPYWRYAVRTAPDHAVRAALLRRLGDNDRMASDYQSAATHYRVAATLLDQAERHSDISEFAWANIGLGKLDRLRADYDAAHRRYTNARDSYVHLLDQTGIAEAEFGIGEVKRLQSDWPAAARAYQSSLEHADSVGNLERRAYALWGLGEVNRLNDRPSEAMAQHRAGLDLCVRLGDRRSEGWALLGIGQVESALGNTDPARAAYTAALELFHQTQSQTEIAHTQLSLAESYRATGEIKFDLYQDAEAIYQKLHLKHCMVQYLLVKACALREIKRRRQGDALLREAHRLAKKCGITAEIRLIEGIRRNRSSVVFPALNFP